jgi:uroporphyrinogen decarboxylase
MIPLSSRDRVLTALSRGLPDRVPKDLSWGLTPAGLREFQQRTGVEDPNDYFNVDVRIAVLGKEIESEIVKFNLAPEGSARREALDQALLERFSPYVGNLSAGSEITEWGVGYVPGSTYHLASIVHPMRDFSQPDALDAYPFPCFDEPWRRDAFKEQVRAWHSRGLAVAGKLSPSIFTTCHLLRGFENILVDLVANTGFATALIDRVAEIKRQMAITYAACGVDVLILGSNVASQQGMIMSPKLWRKWFKPRLRRIIEAARAVQPGLPVSYIGQGQLEPILPDLVEIGVNVLGAVQPECMDPAFLKLKYGDRLALWGTISVQTTLPFGSTEDVRAEVKRRIETVGCGGGFMIGPSHVPGPEVPWENIVAFFEAVTEYGNYKNEESSWTDYVTK